MSERFEIRLTFCRRNGNVQTLQRVLQVLGRRGVDVSSFAVDPAGSDVYATAKIECLGEGHEQIRKQVAKLVEVTEVWLVASGAEVA
ncbi:MAG: ACT domain-containing protein, partial [Planctomycetota bacterium]